MFSSSIFISALDISS